MKIAVILTAIFIVVGVTGIVLLTRPKTARESSPSYELETYKVQPQQTMPTKPAAPSSTVDIDTEKTYTAILHTDAGDITIELNAGSTPVTVNNFVSLAKKGFYDNTVFHRVIKGFMIQGGDPKGDGTGGPGYRFDDEPFEGEYSRGTVAMANAGPNTNGSQFFIMHADFDLPKNYVIFGKVTSGMEVVDAIASAPVRANSFGEESTPVTPVKVLTVDIRES